MKSWTRLIMICYVCIEIAGDETQNLVDYYERLIEESLKTADEAQVPRDAREYEAEDTGEPEDFGLFDFVIVGAGASGTVVANRLSEIENWKILLIEAGDFSNNFTQIPLYSFPGLYTGYGWYYESTPQQTACLGNVNKVCPYPRGRGIGGTTLVNALVYSRGHPIDLDQWAAQGNPGWSYKEVLPYFKKSEDFHRTDPKAPVDNFYHGTHGYLNVEYSLPRNRFLDTFLEAGQELGYNLTDFNSPNEIGLSPAQLNTRNGRRADGGSAFLSPILQRNNLKIITNSYVIKIHINEKTKEVVGVHFTHQQKIYEARVKKEAILSAGALATPQLLMLSGIGPKEHLQDLGISVIKDLPVGSFLRDHSKYMGLSFSSNTSTPIRSLKENIEEYLKGEGPLTLPGPNPGVGFFQTSVEKIPNYPDLEMVLITPNVTSKYSQQTLQFSKTVYDSLWGSIDYSSSFNIYLVNLHQRSTGTLRLRSKSPYDFPLINSNFLSDPADHDINVLYQGIKLVFKLIRTKSFQQINAKLQVKPVPGCINFKPFSKEYWFCSLRYLTFNNYHPMGTCPMGPNPKEDHVVNNKLEVYGIKKLRVVDASIFPLSNSGHPNALCVMIGEKASDMIKNVYN